MNRKITIKDVAELSGTSKTTVSFYLNQKFDKMSLKTRKKIERVIEEYDYVPNRAARSLNRKETKIIGIIVGQITTGFSNKLVSGIEEMAFQKDYQVMMASSYFLQDREFQCINNMLQANVDGFIIQPSQNFDASLNLLKQHKKDVVFVDSFVEGSGVDSVVTNNYEATGQMMEGLRNLGYDGFSIIQGDPQKITTRQERYQGFIHGLKNGEDYHSLIVSDELNEITDEEIIHFLEKIVSTGHKNAVFISNCWLLPKVYHVATQEKFRDLIPERLILYGFDNEEWLKNLTPKIPSIVQPAYEEGKRSFELLYQKLSSHTRESKVVKEILHCDFINLKIKG